jgi:hypothetical protein
MASMTPVWSDNVSLISLQTLAKGSVVRAVVDWRTKIAARVWMQVGKQGTTTMSSGIICIVRPTVNAGAIILPSSGALQIVGDLTAAARTTCAASGNNAGVTSITVASTTGILAGQQIFIDDTGNAGLLAGSEWARVAFVTSATVLLLDAPTQFAHNSVNAHVSNHADLWGPFLLDGGAEYEIIFDYGAPAAGDTHAVRALAQTLDSYSIV